MDSIGRFPVGRSAMKGRKNFLLRTIRKMEVWRDNARINLFQQRRRYQQKIERNQASMKAKKAGRLPNLNPSSKLNEIGFKPKSLHRYEVTHSTVPLKPRYSIVKPAKRIYGNRWKKLSFSKKEIPKAQKSKLSKERKIHTIEIKRGAKNE